jgi:23S rRNA (pseudouridine1915-N3)-methyltransferase
MRLVVASVGRLKDGAERALFERYRDRFAASAKPLGFSPVTWVEVPESRAGAAARRMTEEAEALLRLTRDAEVLVVLDALGKSQSSEAFARLVGGIRDGGAKAAAIVIGGPDGLDASVRKTARCVLSLGAMTLPHGLVRIIVAEQLYRAATILAGHPYHRG